MRENELEKWFEGIWATREERIYPAFFGDLGPGIYGIPESTFQSIGGGEPDPRYLTHGVFESPPHDQRADWIYVSSGMSNPWGDTPETVDPANFSGLGFEFTMHTSERARWPIQVMHWVMAVQLLVANGEVKGALLERADRIPLGGALWKKDGLLTHILVTEPPEPAMPGGYPREFLLPSGKVDLMLLIGITAREAEFAATQGDAALVNLLRHHGIFPRTDPGRISVV
jgi:hypothetical protein